MARTFRSTRSLVGALVALGCLAACEAAPGDAGPDAVAVQESTVHARGKQGHLLLTVEISSAGARVLDARDVASPMPRGRPAIGARWHVEVRDDSGRALWATDVRPADVVTGEFPDEDGEYERVEAHQGVGVFSVRVPALEGASTIAFSARSLALHPSDRRRRPGATVDDDDVIALGTVAFPEVTP